MIRKLFFILLTVSSLSCFAQTSSIGIDSANYNIDTFVTFNQSVTWQVRLFNAGPTAINDSTIKVYIQVDTSGGTWAFFDSATVNLTNFAVSDTHTVNISDMILPLGGGPDSLGWLFKPGVNPVVIWPKASSFMVGTYNYLYVDVFVDTTGSGIHDQDLLKGFIMYPNPSKDFLYFTSLNPDHPYKKIKFYDLDGRLVLETNFASKIDVSTFKNGLYTVVVETLDGGQKKLKFLKE